MERTLDQALRKGVEAHKSGKVREADQYYTAILKADPKHPDANHNMGVLAVGLGQVETALPFFKKALEANSGQNHHKKILNSDDFYSLSELKDLLFHVQEHRFTIPQIKDCLSDLGLKFCGFESDDIVAHFKLNHTGIGDPYDLDIWHAYEEANPKVFARMYQFWCQKVACNV